MIRLPKQLETKVARVSNKDLINAILQHCKHSAEQNKKLEE